MNMAIDFDGIRRDHPLEAVVGKVVQLRRSGANKVACCPFHADKTPSLVLYKDQTYHCFGCGAHGDVLDFVAGTQKISISGAIRYLTGGNAPVLDDADQQRRAQDMRRREAAQAKHSADAVQGARSRWARAVPVDGTENGYLVRKNVAPYGCRREGDNLLVPIFDEQGLIASVQSIPPEAGGKKLFHAGAPVKGGSYTLGDTKDGPVIITEGFATGATVQAATGHMVVIGFSKGALKRTAEIAAKRYPGRAIIIAADANGVDEAHDAADAVGGHVALPDLQGADGTDFNDQACHYGLEDVAAVFATPTLSKDKIVYATPFVWRPTAAIPKRRWLYGKHLLRGFVSLDVAAGGVGKSSLKIGEALAMATGRDLYDQGLPEGPLTVWLWNLEDPVEEIERRIHATAQRFRIQPHEIADRLYVDSGRDQPLIIATEGPDGLRIAKPVVDALIAEMLERKVDVLTVDPFVSSHGVSENDNNAIDLVAREWNHIAEKTGASINLVHHVRKQNGAEATADSARGASSLIGKARSVQVFNRMSDEEATKLNVPTDERKFFFRVDNDKANLAPPEKGVWYRMNNEDLANGDSVGVACSWTPPGAFDGITARHLYQVQKAISEGKWRENVQTKDAWVGNAVAAVLDLNPEDKHVRIRIGTLLRTWVEEGALEVVDEEVGHRKTAKFVVVRNWVEL